MNTMEKPWPNDADGDVMRRLEASGFDFSLEHVVDFNVDLESWPPPSELVSAIHRRFDSGREFPPDDEGRGYIQFQIKAHVTYELVTSVQREVSQLAQPFGGVCESWGVWQE